MAAVLGLVGPALAWLGPEWFEHKRSNRLHRESLAQALRVHEAESLAEAEYHRVHVGAANDQHSRETLQRRYQHEEDLDNEKRVATRDNIRDDWQKLALRAETVLIVNTLVLAVAFSMLIEGHLPDVAPRTMPVTSVMYLSAVACSICLLLSSVRFAVVLRFRVGCTIVDEMREAIARTMHLDDAFRAHEAYLRCNRPEVTPSACDPRYKGSDAYQHTKALTWQMRFGVGAGRARGGPSEAAAEGQGTVPQKVCFAEEAVPGPGYEDISWVATDATGYALRWPATCDRRLESDRLRPRLSMLSDDGAGGSADGVVRNESAEWDNNPASVCSSSDDQPGSETNDPVVVLPSREARRRDRGPSPPPELVSSGSEQGLRLTASEHQTQSTMNHVVSGASSSAEATHGTEHSALRYAARDVDVPRTSLRSQSISEVTEEGDAEGCEARPTGVDEALILEAQYRQLVRWRLEQNEVDQQQLKALQIRRCQPWATASRLLLFSGSSLLLLASCLLVYGRFGDPIYTDASAREELPSAARLGAWAFVTPCFSTCLVLLYLEALLYQFRRRHRVVRATRRKRRRIRRDAQAAGDRDSDESAPSEKPDLPKAVSLGSLYSGVGTSRSFFGSVGSAGSAGSSDEDSAVPLDERADRGAPFLSYALLVLVLGSMPIFFCLAWSLKMNMAERSASGAMAPPLRAETLALAEDSHWPTFWTASAAAWLPQEQALLLVGGRDVVYASVSHGSAVEVHPALLQVESSQSPPKSLDCLCNAQGPGEEVPQLLATDGEGRLYTLELSADSRVRLMRAAGALGMASGATASRPDALGCQSIHAQAVIGQTSQRNLWLSSASGDGWPTLGGAEGVQDICLAPKAAVLDSRPDAPGACQLNMTRQWPVDWLLRDPAVESAIRAALVAEGMPSGPSEVAASGAEIEGIAVLRDGGLVILATLRPHLQLIAMISSTGQLRQWWRVEAPRGSARQKWATLAVDEARGRAFLVAGGLEPRVAVLQLVPPAA